MAVPLKELQSRLKAGPPYDAAFLDTLAADPRSGARKILEQAERNLAKAVDAVERLRTMLEFERGAVEQGFNTIAGVDEAGRGPLAGPVVAGAVVLKAEVWADPETLETGLRELNDSKQLKEAQRESLFEVLMAGEHAYGVGIVVAEEIDQMGIQQANFTAMHRAIEALPQAPDYLLVDGYNLPGTAQPAQKIIKGDARSLSIAAASIIAKVTRDRIMLDMDKKYPHYGFAKHKGYGTAQHLAAIEAHGPCPLHRMTFAPLAELPTQTELL